MLKMKSFVVFLLTLYGVVHALEKEKAIADCTTELSIEPDIKEHIKNHGELPDENDKNAKCMFHCVSKKIGLTGDDGTIDKDKVIGYIANKHPDLDKTKLESVVLLCGERSETDPCEKWYEFTKCQLKAYLEYKKNSSK